MRLIEGANTGPIVVTQSSTIITTGVDIRAAVVAIMGVPSIPVHVVYRIPSGYVAASNSTSTAALDTGATGLPAGSVIDIVNEGLISGMGGNAGGGATVFITLGSPASAGANGGKAINIRSGVTVRIHNKSGGIIAGGGGGGGGGGACAVILPNPIPTTHGGGGGGGGRSYVSTSGGAGGTAAGGTIDYPGQNGGGGISTIGGNGGGGIQLGGSVGGAGGAGGTTANGGTGGTGTGGPSAGGGGGGGGYASYGGTGGNGYTAGATGGLASNGASGGAPGKAIEDNGNSFILLNDGSIYGATT